MAESSLVFRTEVEFSKDLDVWADLTHSRDLPFILVEFCNICVEVNSQAVAHGLFHHCPTKEAFCVFNDKHSALIVYVC